MEKKVSRIYLLSAGMINAVLGALGGLIWGIIEVLNAASFGRPIRGTIESFVLGIVVVMILCPIIGFIGGLIEAAVYNFAASITGGLKIELADVESPPESQPQRRRWAEVYQRIPRRGKSPSPPQSPRGTSASDSD